MTRSSVRTALLSILFVVAVSCSGDASENGSPTGPATGATATGPTTATGSTAGGPTGATVAAPLVSGPLEPGTYTFDGSGEPLTLTVGEGWEALIEEGQANETPLGSFLALFNAEHPAANLAFVHPTRVVDPLKDWDEEGNVVPLPDDLIAWMHDHPMHDSQEPFDTTVGGLPARAVDIVVAEVPKNGWPSCGGQCVLWFPLSVDQEDGPLTEDDLVFGGANKEHDRQIVVEVGEETLVADIGAINAKSFEAFLPLAEEVLATVQFG